jgi:ATP-dependent helicase HrpB
VQVTPELNILPPLPIDEVLPQLIATLRSNSSVVLQAPTGAGKTTRVPPAILDAGLAGKGRIVMLEPRRLAARAAARRMSIEHGTVLGGEIGYQVRFDKKCGPSTRIMAVTPGILLRMLHDDPYLESISVLIFDEFHERGLESDLALGIARIVQQTVRPDLKLIVMSATLATERISAYLGGCPIVESEGRLFPVDIIYDPRPNEQSWPFASARAVSRLLKRTAGDILVFLPGMYEIRQTERELEALAHEHDLAVLVLHGDLPPEQQDAALLPQSRRKVVLATNVAETSVTVEGVTGVVDMGQARQMFFDPGVGLDRLDLTPISKASADQRAGRAGRTEPGVCIRLWSEVAHRSRPDQTDAEIRRVDVSGAVLQLLRLGEADPLRFPWLDPPPESAVMQALSLLRILGAVDAKGLTDLGKRMAALPVHPRLARLLIAGRDLGCAGRAALAAALLGERDPFQRSKAPTSSSVLTNSDVLDRIEAMEEFERTGRFQFAIGELHRGAASFILRARDQLGQLLDDARPAPTNAPVSGAEEPMLRALMAAYPDRLARRRNHGGTRGVMVGGRGVILLPSSRVLETELFLCIDVDAGATEALVRQASSVSRDWLAPEGLKETRLVEFNPNSEKIEARRTLQFEDLLLDSTPILLPNTEETAGVLAKAALERFDRIRPAPDSQAGQYLLRAGCLRKWLPELALPAFDAKDMGEILSWLCAGCRSFDDLKKADWLGAIHGKLTHQQRQAVEREVPEGLEVPSGSRIALSYEAGRPPVLAVRIQELFGLADTPRIAGGRVRVLLHLLAPNFRPQQVTDDLASFWANTYPIVRKELRARYPKHAWPENPLDAEAVRGPKRRGT